MFNKNVTVKRPEGTIIYKKNGYVYHTIQKIYLKTKHHNQNKRICIGKMIDDVYMIPNEHFEDYYPLDIPLKEPPLLSDTVSVGLNTVIDKLLDDTQIKYIFDDIFDVQSINLIKDLMSYMISSESTVIQHFPNIVRRTNIFSNKIYSDSYISTFFKETITSKLIETFLYRWNSIERKKDIIYISYDSTNMNTHSNGIDLAEYGHSKDDEGLPQVNLSLAINQEESLPLFYELYPGSIIDNSQLKHMIGRLSEYGYQNIGVIMDRGYFSINNIKYLEEKGFNYVLMVKTSQNIIQDIIKTEGLKLSLKGQSKYYISGHDVFGLTIKKKIYKSDKKESYFHLYYDPERSAYEAKNMSKIRVALEKELDEHLNKKIRKKEDLTKYNKYFKLKFDNYGYFKRYEVNHDYIENTSYNSGFFSIITSANLTAKEALDIYRNRDTVEKLFESLKSSLDYTKFRVGSNSSLIGKTFITFLATIIRSRIFYQTKDLKTKDNKSYTIPSIINELNNIEVTKNAKDIYIRRYSLTSKQKTILNQFKLTDRDIDASTHNLNNRKT